MNGREAVEGTRPLRNQATDAGPSYTLGNGAPNTLVIAAHAGSVGEAQSSGQLGAGTTERQCLDSVSLAVLVRI